LRVCLVVGVLVAVVLAGCGESGEEPSLSDNGSNYDGDLGEIPPPPVIANVVISEITRTSAVITWETDVESTSQVQYGPTPQYGERSNLDSERTTQHRVLLEQLRVATEYHLRALSSRGTGHPVAMSENFTFSTAAPNFSQDILPIFQQGCNLGIRCHAEAVGQSELKLEGYATLMKGGRSGRAIVPGDPGASLLYKRVTGAIPPRMPLDNPPLSAEQIELIRKWIDAGAKDD
jgi:hypothetical protein